MVEGGGEREDEEERKPLVRLKSFLPKWTADEWLRMNARELFGLKMDQPSDGIFRIELGSQRVNEGDAEGRTDGGNRARGATRRRRGRACSGS